MNWLFLLLLSSGGIGTEVGIYFSPHGGCESAVVNEVKNAKSEILIAIYYFTDKEIADALCMARKRGVKIEVVLDKSQKTTKYSKVNKLMENNIPARFDTRNGLMHNKFAVIDDKIVVTGSFNWTEAAENKNRENLIIIKNPEIAGIYKKEFTKLWSASVEATGKVTRTEILVLENKSVIRVILIVIAIAIVAGLSTGVVKKKRKKKK